MPLGHRRKIFAAINQGAESIQPIAEGTRGVEPKNQRVPERRRITVLFSDLVGSTAMSERMDAEDVGVDSIPMRVLSELGQSENGIRASWNEAS